MNEPIKSYKDLVVWQKSLQWVKQVYELTRSFPANALRRSLAARR
jgi:hypothetical protein